MTVYRVSHSGLKYIHSTDAHMLNAESASSEQEVVSAHTHTVNRSLDAHEHCTSLLLMLSGCHSSICSHVTALSCEPIYLSFVH